MFLLSQDYCIIQVFFLILFRHLLQILQKIANEAGFDKPVAELTDEVIIYHLKMCDKDRFEPIPGIKKDYEDDFKTALLKARGIIKE